MYFVNFFYLNQLDEDESGDDEDEDSSTDTSEAAKKEEKQGMSSGDSKQMNQGMAQILFL